MIQILIKKPMGQKNGKEGLLDGHVWILGASQFPFFLVGVPNYVSTIIPTIRVADALIQFKVEYMITNAFISKVTSLSFLDFLLRLNQTLS